MTTDQAKLAELIMQLSKNEKPQPGEGLSSYVTRRSGGMATIESLQRTGVASRKTLGRWLYTKTDKLDIVIDGVLVNKLRNTL